MLWFVSKRWIKKEFKKVFDSFKLRDNKIDELKKEIVSKDMIKLMIENEILKINKIREQVRSSPRTPLRKKADKLLNKAEIMREMALNEEKGLSTQENYDIIVEQKGLIKRTCFYKYLKQIRELTPRTTRTPQTN